MNSRTDPRYSGTVLGLLLALLVYACSFIVTFVFIGFIARLIWEVVVVGWGTAGWMLGK